MGITGEYKLFSVTQANQSRRGSLAEGDEFCMHPSELGEIINFNVCHKRWPGLGVGVRLSGIVFMVCWVMGLTSPDFLTDSVCFEIFNESALQFFFLCIPSKEHFKLTTPESSKPSYVGFSLSLPLLCLDDHSGMYLFCTYVRIALSSCSVVFSVAFSVTFWVASFKVY